MLVTMRIGKIVIILFAVMLTGVMPNTTNIVMGLTGPPTIFGVDGSGNLSSISTTTGVATTIGPLGGLYTKCGAIDFDPVSGTLYGVCPNGTVTDNDLVTINTSTGTATLVGTTSIDGPVQDISFNSTGGLFAIGFDAGFNFRQIFSVSLSDGATVDVSITNLPFIDQGNGLAFDATDTLWHSDNSAGPSLNTMHNVSPVNESVTTIYASATYVGEAGPGGFPPFTSGNKGRINAMDVDTATNIMYASTFDGGGGGGPAYLSTVDIATTGDVTFIGQTVNGLDGIAFQAGQEIIGGVGLPIDTTALLIAGVQTSAMWIIPVFASIGIAGLVIFKIKSKAKNKS